MDLPEYDDAVESRAEQAAPINRTTRLLTEGALIGLALVTVVMLLALVTYDSGDPGWSSSGSNANVQNAVGPVGAWLADVLFSLLGKLAYAFPLLVAYRVWRLFRQVRRDEIEKDSRAFIAVRTSGLVVALITGAALVYLNTTGDGGLPAGTGGAIGQSLGDFGYRHLGFVGSCLVFFSLSLFSVSLFANISWLQLFDSVGDAAFKLTAVLTKLFNDWRASRVAKQEVKAMVQERSVKLEQEKERRAEREPVMIKVEPQPVEQSARVQKEKQVELFEDFPSFNGDTQLPNISLLDSSENDEKRGYSAESLEAMSRLLELKLKDFGISVDVVEVLPGPVVTRFEIQPAPGVKASRITNLSQDLARSLAVISVRVVEVIAGKSVMGIEIPNEHRQMVRLSDVIASQVYDESKSSLTIALGHDISGQPVIADLARMPHLLVAGTTGSGKSVGVNAMLLSLLYKSTPKDVRLLLVDPKMLELAIYEGIPHLLAPVITDMKDAANGLRWCVGEMERRYKLMAKLGVRNLAGYNRKVNEAIAAGEPIVDPIWAMTEADIELHEAIHGEVPTAPNLEPLPAIVVVIDEFADMMMIVGKKVEQLIARIAQKARAAGIHLILATQRPSVDVITGLIKANVPTRMAFQVSSRIDSRTILDQGGAEHLLGHGDMLYLPVGSSVPVRVHGAFVDDHEVHKVVAQWAAQGEPEYVEGLTEEATSANVPVPGYAPAEGDDSSDSEADALYDEAVAFVLETRKASISSVQRKLRVGYNRAARLIETMEAAGVVSEAGHNGNREVLAPAPPRSD